MYKIKPVKIRTTAIPRNHRAASVKRIPFPICLRGEISWGHPGCYEQEGQENLSDRQGWWFCGYEWL